MRSSSAATSSVTSFSTLADGKFGSLHMQRLNKATAWSAALLLLASLPVGAAPKSSPRALMFQVGAMQRSYVEYLPPRLETPTAAVVIVLHGLGGSERFRPNRSGPEGA
jgi:poly(3-hydroxybutyrate) depolymerase